MAKIRNHFAWMIEIVKKKKIIPLKDIFECLSMSKYVDDYNVIG